MRTLVNKLLKSIQKSDAYVFLLSKILPNISLNYFSIIPVISWSPFYNKPSNSNFSRWGELYKEGLYHLREGDLVFSYNKRKITSNLIGKFSSSNGFTPSHVAYCKGRGILELAEMQPKGYNETTFADICFESTRIIIMRCSDFDEDYIKRLTSSLDKIKHLPYDFGFFMDSKELSCSEAIYHLDHKLNKGRIKVSAEPIIGNRKYVTPTGLYKSKNLYKVWDSLETNHRK